MDYQILMNKAEELSKKAYAPYSEFRVGACILTANDKIFTGCNFENSSYGLSICAERNAAGAAVAGGETKFKAIAVYSPNMENCYPCGACRQVLHEFECDDGIDIILKDKNGLNVRKLKEIFPDGFRL